MSPGGVRRYLHPFPARMAPEVALQKISLLTARGDVVLDPMCGSGTVVRLAADEGRKAIGVDLDPLAILITRSTCSPGWLTNLESRAQAIVRQARGLTQMLPEWVASDDETTAFVSFWFGPNQADALSRLARVLASLPRKDDPLRVALSRLIITKDSGASLARDTAHSRPHKVRETNDFDVYNGFISAARRLEGLGVPAEGSSRSQVRRCDARNLSFLDPEVADLVITSPPYLNAIDYLRGHRMSLVWLGWTIPQLRQLRANTIGAERSLNRGAELVASLVKVAVPRDAKLPPRQVGMISRFARDVDRLAASLARVVKKHGHVVMVVANSQFDGVPIRNAAICRTAAAAHGFSLTRTQQRALPARHRYLPPPGNSVGSLSQRIRKEEILTFRKG